MICVFQGVYSRGGPYIFSFHLSFRFGEDIFSPVQTLPDSSDPVSTPTTVSRLQVGADDEHPGDVREAGGEQPRGVPVSQWTPMNSMERTASPRQSNSNTVSVLV